MGTRGNEIIGMNIEELITLLNRALSDEWLAYYQYWVGSKVVKGLMKDQVIIELVEHANDELRHAEMLSARIVQIGGTPVLKPEDWYKLTNCGYDAPTDPMVKAILSQNIKGEQCAISVYKKICDITKDKDPVTYNIVLEIMTDEIEHEDDLQGLLEDLETVK